MSGPNYKAAPLKAISRRMIVEICRRLVAYGNLRDLTYVGLGAKEFVDFELIYEAIGVQRMLSVESSIPLDRLKFNRPYEQIDIEFGTTNARLPHIAELTADRSVVWLDYTSTFDVSVVTDIAYLGGVLRPGSALFVTLNSHFDPTAETWKPEQIEERFGDYFNPALKSKDYVGLGLGDHQRDAAEAVLTKAMKLRVDDVQIARALDLRYKDSSRMQVVGWIISPKGVSADTTCRLSELDFTPIARGGAPLTLSLPDLTSREWSALVRQLPVATAASLVAPHGHIPNGALEQFFDAYRYVERERMGA